MEENGKIIQVNIEDQMKSAYIDYSMSVIVARALPDVRDGLKPVHRRILYGMHEMGVSASGAHKKSARIVGDVLGKYHPHGDSSVYDAMVRLAQPWSMRYQFVDGKGNFGSMDADSPAAMRYTEARMKKIAEAMLEDIDKETVDMLPNFDGSLEEPSVLPAKIPALLVNGSSGIAVGMATNMAPHNLSEVIDATVAYIDNKDIEIDELIKYVKAPDFPTGGIIYGTEGVKDAYFTGRGRVIMRGEASIEMSDKANEHDHIIISSIPYQVNKAELVKKIADLANEGVIVGIHDVRDESTADVRIVVELKRDAVANVVLNKLYQYSPLQSSFSINNIALVNGRPQLLNLKDLIHYFVGHRHEVLIRKTQYELRKAEERAHILEGLLKALDIIDQIIAHIRASQSVQDAVQGLIDKWDFSEIQAKAIVEMRLRQLTGLEREKLEAEYNELMNFIAHCKEILDNEALRMQILKEEMLEVKAKFGDERKSRIEYSAKDFRIEDMIADQEVVITISHLGYIKRTLLSEYQEQKRGGKGSRGSDVRDQDYIEQLFVATTHNYLLLFTDKGRCYWMRIFDIPEGTKTSKGRAIQNMLNIDPDDKIRAYINVKDLRDEEYVQNNFIVLCTKQGVIKKTSLEAYSRPRANGINAINIRENDQLLEAKLTNGTSEIMIAVRCGKVVRFNEQDVRPMGRNATGVRAVRMSNKNDEAIGMVCVDNTDYDILVVSENGFGKRTKLVDEDGEDVYRITRRGGKGVKTLNVTEKTGSLVAIKNVLDSDDLMIITQSGIIIRTPVKNISKSGRNTQGVTIIRLKSGDGIASVTQVPTSEEEGESEE
ncbi:MAG: DNA gyrase subunit A [Bacteroidales bacterium]|jgi:DNA gyrase subunit A|nr:DNA gyrase subunit A [Bacteroidales bacterium]